MLLFSILKRLKGRFFYETQQGVALRKVEEINYSIHHLSRVKIESGELKIGELKIGEEFAIDAHSVLLVGTGPGDDRSQPSLRLGNRVDISEFFNLRAASGMISLGHNTLIAAYTSMVATNHGASLEQVI